MNPFLTIVVCGDINTIMLLLWMLLESVMYLVSLALMKVFRIEIGRAHV